MGLEMHGAHAREQIVWRYDSVGKTWKGKKLIFDLSALLYSTDCRYG